MKPDSLKRRWIEQYTQEQPPKSPRLSPSVKQEPIEFPQHTWSDTLNISFSAQSAAIFQRRKIGRTKVSDYSYRFPTWKSIARQAIIHFIGQWVTPAGTVNLEWHNATLNRYCETFTIPPTDERVGLRGQLGIRAKTTILPFTPLGLYIGYYLCSHGMDNNTPGYLNLEISLFIPRSILFFKNTQLAITKRYTKQVFFSCLTHHWSLDKETVNASRRETN